MGTMANATLWDVEEGTATAVLRQVRAATMLVDSLMSTYRENSEISRVNRHAGSGRMIQLSPETAYVLARAIEIGKATGGRLDVTIAPLVDLWRFKVAWRGEEVEPPARSDIDSVLSLVGQDALRFDSVVGTVLLARPGMRIDLGSIAKGYALDLASQEIRDAGLDRAYLELGGQVRLVGQPADKKSWRLGIRHPREPERIAAIASIDGGSLATSGDYERYFVWNGRRHFHIIDPSTGWPAYGTASVTVWAPTGVDADAWSTALFVAGPDPGIELLSEFPEIGAIWIQDPGPSPLTREHIVIAGSLAGRVQLLTVAGGSPID
jgi:thiamine biosynthesis lipoprotein